MEKERIRVVFFLPSLEVGGTERGVVNLVNYIDEQKYRVSILLGKLKGDFIKEVKSSIEIENLNASVSLGLFFSLVRYFKTQKPDIFISAFPRVNVICILAKIFSGASVKIIITEHSVFSMLPVIAKTSFRRLIARFFMPAMVRFLYPKADAIICVARGIASDLQKSVKTKNDIKVIYNPVINDGIYQLALEQVNHLWFVNQDIPVIVAVGRLVECKDYPNLFKAFKLVLKKKPTRLVILGDGPEKENLRNLVNQMGLSSSIAFLGFQSNPFKYMKQSSVFVLSSLQEGFGNVIIEAMACGVPVVSTNCPVGPGEIIENNKNGILVPVGNYQKMSDAILGILNNLQLAKNLISSGKERAEFFSVNKSVAEYEKVFEELMQVTPIY